jgi:hypothetical protein
VVAARAASEPAERACWSSRASMPHPVSSRAREPGGCRRARTARGPVRGRLVLPGGPAGPGGGPLAAFAAVSGDQASQDLSVWWSYSQAYCGQADQVGRCGPSCARCWTAARWPTMRCRGPDLHMIDRWAPGTGSALRTCPSANTSCELAHSALTVCTAERVGLQEPRRQAAARPLRTPHNSRSAR